MQNSIFRSIVGVGISSVLALGLIGSAAVAQTLPLTQAELDQFADLAFKSDRTAEEEATFQFLNGRIKANPPIEAYGEEDEPRYATTQQLKLPYLEFAPDIGLTVLKGDIKYTDSYYYGDHDKTSIDGTAARVGVDVRYNVPINDNLEVFVGAWSFANIGGSVGLHNEEEEELNIGGSGGHYGVVGYSVNNYATAYTGVSIPIGEHFCDCFGPTQISINGYVGARVGEIKLDLDYYNNGGFGNDKVSESETFVSPIVGFELKARSGRLFGTGFGVAGAVGYQYQGGADATIKGHATSETGTFEFDIENQQHFYGSARIYRSF